MSEPNGNGERLEKLVRQAAGVVVASEKKIGYRQAMELVGFAADEVTNAAIYKRVLRRSKAIVVHAETTPVAVVQLAAATSSISSLTGSQDSPATPTIVGTPPRAALETLSKSKQHRRSVKELQCFHAKNNAEKERQKVAMKVATNRIKRNLELPVAHPNRKLIRVIVQEVNDLYHANVHPQTAA
jgi:hypothetical protein